MHRTHMASLKVLLIKNIKQLFQGICWRQTPRDHLLMSDTARQQPQLQQIIQRLFIQTKHYKYCLEGADVNE